MIKAQKRMFAVILNPFIVLGIPENADLDEAKSAYKKMVMKYHPDINKSEDTNEKFREITEAFGMVKKRIESRESSAIPKEEGFVSKRPKYDGRMSSQVRDDKVREYINFRPLDIELPQKDRLGIMYRPFFTDQDATHPKTGTIGIFAFCFLTISAYSFIYMNLAQKDEEINQLIYERLKRKYKDSEWDQSTLHPTLQAVQNDPEYEKYLKRRNEQNAASRFKATQVMPALLDRFNPLEYEKNEEPREYLKVALK